MKKDIFRSMRAALAASALALLAACGGGEGGTSAGSTDGTLRLALTDNPACGYDAVFVTVTKVRVHQSASAGANDAGWREFDVVPVRRINLLDLTNGVLEDLGQMALPAGTYTQMRLVLAGGAGTPLPNAIHLTGAPSETPLTTPSAQTSGLKLNVNMTVEAGKIADFVIDFDACRSIVKAGNSGKYLLKPVLSVIPRIGDAGQRIVGFVDPTTVALGGTTTVSAQLGGTVVKATPPNATTGRFDLYPVPVGTYDLVVTSTNRTTLVMTGVPVTTTAPTLVGSTTARVLLTAATSNVATGVVRKDGSTAETGADVRVTQTLHGGPTIELGARPVDDETGVYSFSLPISAPQIAAYAPNLTLLTFLPDSTDPSLTAAGKYQLGATIPGFTPQNVDINVLGGDVVTPFNFVSP